jgi:hypothetical protein
MNKLFLGKINLSKIDKSKLFDGQTGKWMDITVWFNEEPDQYGNNLSIEQSTKKDESKIYIGNAKFYSPKRDEPKAKEEYQKSGKVDMKSISNPDELDSLPF